MSIVWSQIVRKVYDSTNRALRVNVVVGGGGGGGGTGVVTASQADDSIITGANPIYDASANPMKYFAIQVVKSGAVTSWSVDLEGSADGTNFTKFATVTNVSPGDTKTQFVPTPTLCAYFRSNVTALVLGGGTKITTTIWGSQ